MRISVGDTFSWWTVVEIKTSGRVLCRCRCGMLKEQYVSSLVLGKVFSCGCYRASKTPNIGDLIGEWEVLSRDKGSRFALCRCSCGTEKLVEVYTLGKESLSCGHSRGFNLNALEPPDKKTCFSCFELHPIQNFHKDKKGRKGIRPYCKSCVSQKDRERNNTSPYPTIKSRLEKGGGNWVGDVTIKSLNNLLAIYGGKCWICQRQLSTALPLAWDHYKPLARGGDHSISNLRPSCGPCNRMKYASWPVSEELLTEIRNKNSE